MKLCMMANVSQSSQPQIIGKVITHFMVVVQVNLVSLTCLRGGRIEFEKFAAKSNNVFEKFCFTLE